MAKLRTYIPVTFQQRKVECEDYSLIMNGII